MRCQIRLTMGAGGCSLRRASRGEQSCGVGASLDSQQAAFSGATLDVGRAGCCPAIPLRIGCFLHSVPGKAQAPRAQHLQGTLGAATTVALAVHHDSARFAVSPQALNQGKPGATDDGRLPLQAVSQVMVTKRNLTVEMPTMQVLVLSNGH